MKIKVLSIYPSIPYYELLMNFIASVVNEKLGLGSIAYF